MKMTKNVGLWKIVAGIVFIIATPILFFLLMGVSPLDLEKENKRVIAIVNEDQGLLKDEESVEMGKEVVTLLGQDSSYEWSVVGRGTAESGLKSNQYEAIVYIPSNFSASVMSYDESNPQKAEFNFKLDNQKAGIQKEKVLQEINVATNRVNEKISTLYWSYIAQEMDHIKKEFSNILKTESEFLTAMAGYYKPESEALAEEMTRQKEQMEGVLSTLNSTNQSSQQRIENAEVFEQQMNGFIDYLQQYRTFQEKQKEILQQVQDSSLAQIQAAAVKQNEQFGETIKQLEDNNEKLNQEIKKVNDMVAANQEKFNQLSTTRKQVVDSQLSELLSVQKKAIDRYNFALLRSLERDITNQKDSGVSGIGTVGMNPDTLVDIKDDMVVTIDEKRTNAPPQLHEEITKISELVAVLDSLKKSLQATESDSSLVAELEKVQTELSTLNSEIRGKEDNWFSARQEDMDDYVTATNNYTELLENYRSIFQENTSIRDVLNNYPADLARIGAEIKQKEQKLITHKNMSGSQKERLQELFAKGYSTMNLSSMLSYYATLQQFEYTLNDDIQNQIKDGMLEDEILTALLRDVVNVQGDELEGWTQLEESIPQTQLSVNEMDTTFAAIMSGYEKNIEQQHVALVSELNSINQQANLLLQQLQNPATLGNPEPAQGITEGEVASSGQNISSQLLTLNQMMVSLSDRQKSLVGYANDLHVKAGELKETSVDFTSKWETNATAMGEFEGDIQEFLGNTYVDGQENGYVFEHYVNPLAVKGEAVLSESASRVPPVILFLVLLLSSLFIGYFTYQLKAGSEGMKLAMAGILSLIVGAIISLYSINMYVLNDSRALEWSIFTVLLLLAGASLIKAALEFGQAAGWIAGIALMTVYIIPLLILAVPTIDVPDVLSTVYMSIKYEPETSFILGAVVTAIIASIMLTVSYFMGRKNNATRVDEVHEA